MQKSLDDITRRLNELTASDFDTGSGAQLLDSICADVASLPTPCAAFPELFRLMERLEEADLGSPGSMVHTMERHIGMYESLLAESVSRKPAFLAVWMVNRILNGESSEREKWMRLLETVTGNQAASEAVRHQARDFLAYQRKG